MAHLWYVSWFGVILATVSLLFGKEATTTSRIDSLEEEKRDSFFQEISKSFLYILRHPFLLPLFFGVSIYFFIEEIAGLAWTPYLNQSGIRLDRIGYIFSAISLVNIFLPFVLGKILKHTAKIKILFGTLLMYGLLLVSLLYIETKIYIVSIFIILSTLEEIFSPIEDALINSFIHWKNRATILSIKSMVISLASFIGWPLAGWLLGIITLQQGLILSGCLIVLLSFLYFRLDKKTIKNET